MTNTHLVTVKAQGLGEYHVLIEGSLVGTYWYDRTRDRNGIRCAGKLEDLRDGSEHDLGCFAWAKDAKRWVRAYFAGYA